MDQPHLLIVDGDFLRTPDLDAVLAREGWRVDWTIGDSESEVLPDLVLFDPVALSDAGLALVKSLQALNPYLPLVALGGTEQDGRWLREAGLEAKALHHLGREVPHLAWPATLRSCLGGFGPGAQKFTTEDLFSDILADLADETTPAPVPEPIRAPMPRSIIPPAPRILPPMAFSFDNVFEGSEEFRLATTDIRATVPMPAIHEALSAPLPGAWPEPSAAPPAEPFLESLEEFGNYYLLEKVAVGGMAELFKARQRGVHDFEKIVAIKRILPHLSDNDEFVRMFIDEAKLAAQLTHPNIVQIFDLGKAMEFYYIAMEFVDGRDLRTILRKVREYRLPVPEPIAAVVAMKIASALDYAHRKRDANDQELMLVHRDISPQNIIISFEGAVKLVDFGIAKAATKSTQTMAGALKGKLLYMSPEQALGHPLDGRSDIYSLGLVLFELLTGERCFQADSELGVLEKVRLGRVADVRIVNPGVSPAMAALVAKALQKDVGQRYGSARNLERELKVLLVRDHGEPTEHDLAEYVNMLLKGTRADLEALLNLRYAPEAEAPAEPGVPIPSSEPGPGSAPPAAAGLAPAPGTSPGSSPTLAPVPTPAQPGASGLTPRRPWVVPAILAALILVVWATLRLFK